MNSRRIALCWGLLFWCVFDLSAEAAKKGEIKPIETWSNNLSEPSDPKQAAAIRRIASMRIINDSKTWSAVWKTLARRNDKPPKIDFQKDIVFIALRPQMRTLGGRLLHDGRGNVASLLAGTTSTFSAAYVMMQIPRAGLKTIERRRVPPPPKTAAEIAAAKSKKTKPKLTLTDEARAARSLRAIKTLIKRGKKETGREKLAQLVEKYPDTGAAREAAELLKAE